MLRYWTTLACSLATLALVAVGCNETPTEIDEVLPDPLEPGSNANAAVQTTAPVRVMDPPDFGPPDDQGFFDNEIVGEQTTTRTSQGVSVRIETSELVPGHVYTTWVIFFNTSDASFISVMRLDGKVVGGSGKATISGSFNDLELPEGVTTKNVGVHGIVRSHGPKTDPAVQMATPGGGCTEELDPPDSVPDEAGECANVQAAVDFAE